MPHFASKQPPHASPVALSLRLGCAKFKNQLVGEYELETNNPDDELKLEIKYRTIECGTHQGRGIK